MFWTVHLSIIRSFSLYTQQWHMSYVIQVCLQLASKLSADLYDGQRNCPKHVEFYSKNKFEKLVQLVGFIIRIYHNAWSPECQILKYLFLVHVISSVIGCLCKMLKDTFEIFTSLVHCYHVWEWWDYSAVHHHTTFRLLWVCWYGYIELFVIEWLSQNRAWNKVSLDMEQ